MTVNAAGSGVDPQSRECVIIYDYFHFSALAPRQKLGVTFHLGKYQDRQIVFVLTFLHVQEEPPMLEILNNELEIELNTIACRTCYVPIASRWH